MGYILFTFCIATLAVHIWHNFCMQNAYIFLICIDQEQVICKFSNGSKNLINESLTPMNQSVAFNCRKLKQSQSKPTNMEPIKIGGLSSI